MLELSLSEVIFSSYSTTLRCYGIARPKEEEVGKPESVGEEERELNSSD